MLIRWSFFDTIQGSISDNRNDKYCMDGIGEKFKGIEQAGLSNLFINEY